MLLITARFCSKDKDLDFSNLPCRHSPGRLHPRKNPLQKESFILHPGNDPNVLPHPVKESLGLPSPREENDVGGFHFNRMLHKNAGKCQVLKRLARVTSSPQPLLLPPSQDPFCPCWRDSHELLPLPSYSSKANQISVEACVTRKETHDTHLGTSKTGLHRSDCVNNATTAPGQRQTRCHHALILSTN